MLSIGEDFAFYLSICKLTPKVFLILSVNFLVNCILKTRIFLFFSSLFSQKGGLIYVHI